MRQGAAAMMEGGAVGGRELQFLRVLAQVDLAGRGAALVGSGLPEAPAETGGGIDLYRAERMLDDIGVLACRYSSYTASLVRRGIAVVAYTPTPHEVSGQAGHLAVV